MRTKILFSGLLLSGCSLIVNPADRFSFDDSPEDGGADAGQPVDAESVDAGDIDAGDQDSGAPMAAPTLRYPWNGFRTGSALTGALEPPRNALRPRFMWEPVDGATSYEIAVSSACSATSRDACDFADAVLGTTTETAWRPEANLPVASSAPVGTAYVWRVRACSGPCSPWSEVRYLHVGRLLGDIDGDGYGDIAVGAQDFDGTVMNEGAAYLYSGATTGGIQPPMVFSNPTPLTMARFGNAISAAGDLDGNGFDDIAVAAYLQGVVHIYYGSAAGVSTTPDLTLTDPLEPTASAFGWTLAATDLNGDGFDDLLIGAQSHDSPTNAEGALFVYFGEEGGLGTTPTVLDSPSGQELGQFGFSLGTGDLDGDGLADVVVGAPSFDDTSTNEGIVYVFRGRPTGIESRPHWTIAHPDPSTAGEFGRVVAMGDLDGDGFADLLLAAPYSNDGADEAGAAWVFAGGPGASPPVGLPVSRPTTEAMGWFGSSAAFLRDVNGDGFGEMAIGAPGLDAPRNNEGLVALLLGGPSLTDAVGSVRLVLPPDAREGAFFGFVVAGTDVNADGRTDLLAGAPFFGGHGSAYILAGTGSGVGAPIGARLDHPDGQGGATFGWALGRGD